MAQIVADRGDWFRILWLFTLRKQSLNEALLFCLYGLILDSLIVILLFELLSDKRQFFNRNLFEIEGDEIFKFCNRF